MHVAQGDEYCTAPHTSFDQDVPASSSSTGYESTCTAASSCAALLGTMQARPRPLTEEALFFRLARGDFKSVVVCTGAGVSKAAGIPDFRSSGGLFESIRRRFGDDFPEVLSDPEMLLSRSFKNRHAQAWHTHVLPWLDACFEAYIREAQPTRTHHFCAWLHRQGWLRCAQHVGHRHDSSSWCRSHDKV